MLMANHGIHNTTQHSQRGNVYRLLAECYRYPNKEMGNELAFLERETDGLDPGLGIRGKELKKLFDSSQSGLAELGIAFSKLFVGPFQLIAAPYGSVYLDENRQAMGDSTMRVIQYYIDAGLNPNDDNKEPPDHISTELEFMYYLIFQHLETGDSQFLGKQRQFLLTQLHLWVPKFAGDIVKSQIHPFYSSLASMTKDFLRWELSWLDQQQ